VEADVESIFQPPSCFHLIIPTSSASKHYGGKQILMQFHDTKTYIHFEDEELARNHFGVDLLDAILKNRNEYYDMDNLPEYVLYGTIVIIQAKKSCYSIEFIHLFF
jgi:hypothetical protein